MVSDSKTCDLKLRVSVFDEPLIIVLAEKL
jgi:hypothetical protein